MFNVNLNVLNQVDTVSKVSNLRCARLASHAAYLASCHVIDGYGLGFGQRYIHHATL